MKPSRPSLPICTAIVCAYNEEKYLAGVVDGLLNTPLIQEIVVVDDGSQDQTAAILRRYEQIERVHPLILSPNQGKGNAMAEGISAASGDILLFVDADLTNWDANYAAKVLEPILADRADMVIGYPLRADDPWENADVLHYQRWLSGERAVWRSDLLPILSKLRPSRFGAETLINMHFRTLHQPISLVPLSGLLHVIKFEKSPHSEAWVEYVREVRQILRTYARHPQLTIMAHVPDFIDLHEAVVALYDRMRRSISIMTL